MMRWLTGAILACGCLLATPALAEDLPRFDISLYCRANAQAGPQTCRRTEESRRVALQAKWENFPKQRKHFCVQSVSFKPRDQRSYGKLAACLDDPVTS
jgi:hypothetical protein